MKLLTQILIFLCVQWTHALFMESTDAISFLESHPDILAKLSSISHNAPEMIIHFFREDTAILQVRYENGAYTKPMIMFKDNTHDNAETVVIPTTESFPGFSIRRNLPDVFALHSNPAAKKKFYLDFDGHVLQNTYWNDWTNRYTITAYPFDTDGDPASFSGAEREAIFEIWRRVIPAFEVLDVDITTEYVGNSEDFLEQTSADDEYYGVRAIVANGLGQQLKDFPDVWGWGVTNALFVDDERSYYNSVCIMADLMQHNVEYIAKCIQHELGHSAGLSHDGTVNRQYYSGHSDPDGTHAWSPIMGSPYHKLSQFSKGEYFQANQLQDDYAILGKSIGFLADDFAGYDTQLFLQQSGAIQGMINFPYDMDCWMINSNANNSMYISAEPSTVNSHVVIRVFIVDEKNEILDLVTPGNFSLGKTGMYRLCVSGAGYGSPMNSQPTGWTAYGSVGKYSLQLLLPTQDANLAVQTPVVQLEVKQQPWFESTTFLVAVIAVVTLAGIGCLIFFVYTMKPQATKILRVKIQI